MAVRIIAALMVVLLLTGLLLYSQVRRGPITVSGYLEADQVQVGSRVGGRISLVTVQEGQHVDKGQLLVQFEPFDLEQRLAQAQAQLEARQAEHEKLASGYRTQEVAQAQAHRDQLAAHLDELVHGPRVQEIAAAKARVQLAQAQQTLAELTFQRVQTTFTRGAATPDELDRANAELSATRALLSQRQAELMLLQEGTRPELIAVARAQLQEAQSALDLLQAGYQPQDVAQALAAVRAAQAAVAAIEKQLAELQVTAPLPALVEAVDIHPGDLIAANAPVLSLLDTSHLWVRAYVPENHLNLRLGQELEIRIDSFPGRRFSGTLSFLATQAEFTPGNVQTPEDRSKQVFRIKVDLDRQAVAVLRAGMAADIFLPADSQASSTAATPSAQTQP